MEDQDQMMKIRMIMFAALAVIVAFGVCGQQAQAQNSRTTLSVVGKAPTHPVTPDASPSLLYQGVTTMGVLPPADPNGNAYWPCFTGGGSNPNSADCSTIPAGGVVFGFPVYTWPLTSCTGVSSTAPCGQVYWTFEDDNSTSGEISAQVVVKQGTSYVYDSGYVKLGKNTGLDGYILAISFDVAFGVGNCTPTTVTCVAPVSGPATITVYSRIGSDTPVTGTYKITLQ
jgi:hypothetical protein